MIHSDCRIIEQGYGYRRVDELPESFVTWTGDKVVQTSVKAIDNCETILIRLVNGVEIKCSPHLPIKTYRKRREKTITFAKDLTSKHLVNLTENVFEFDYIDNKLESFELGILAGLFHILGKDFDIPKKYKEVNTEIVRILESNNIPYTKETYFKRTDRNKYIFDTSFLEPFSIKDKIPEIFWTSKVFMKGFLKTLFTFAIIGNKMFTIRANKESYVLKEIQQMLLLFGINSSYSKGLKVSQLRVFGGNCYRFAYRIGIFNAESLFVGVDFKRFLVYKDITTSDMRYAKVLDVEMITEGKLFEIESNQFMSNGVILENYER